MEIWKRVESGSPDQIKSESYMKQKNYEISDIPDFDILNIH